MQHRTTRLSKKEKIVILDDHPAKVETLEAIEVLIDLQHPRRNVTTPILRNQVEHRRPRLPLQLQRLQVREPASKPRRRGGVAERNRHMLPSQRVKLVPALTHLRYGVTVLRVVDVRDNAVQDLVDEAVAPRAPVLRRRRHGCDGNRERSGRNPRPVVVERVEGLDWIGEWNGNYYFRSWFDKPEK